jgi:hypothetical protein
LIVLVLAAICFAGWRTRFVPSLFQYFFAQALYAMVIFPLNWFYGTSSTIYAVAYTLLTSFILLAVGRIVTEAISEKQNSWRGAALAAILAVTMGHMAWSGMPGIKYYYVIGVIEGTALLWAGLVLGSLAAYTECWDIALTLAALWISQAVWRWGFYLHFPGWLRLNWVVSPLLCIIAFVIIGFVAKLRADERIQG